MRIHKRAKSNAFLCVCSVLDSNRLLCCLQAIPIFVMPFGFFSMPFEWQCLWHWTAKKYLLFRSSRIHNSHHRLCFLTIWTILWLVRYIKWSVYLLYVILSFEGSYCRLCIWVVDYLGRNAIDMKYRDIDLQQFDDEFSVRSLNRKWSYRNMASTKISH